LGETVNPDSEHGKPCGQFIRALICSTCRRCCSVNSIDTTQCFARPRKIATQAKHKTSCWLHFFQDKKYTELDYTGLLAMFNNVFIEKTKNLPLRAAPDQSERGVSRFDAIVGILGKDIAVETTPTTNLFAT
jgi:hypothetical protein